MLRHVIVALTLTQVASGQTAEPPVQLRWVAPEGCPSEAYVRERTEALLVRGLDDPGHPALAVVVTVERRASGWRASLELTTPAGRRVRVLGARSCEALADAAALLLALTIDPTARPGEEGPSAAPVDRPVTGISLAMPEKLPSSPITATVAPPTRLQSGERGSPPARRLRGFLGAAFSVQAGGAPGAALGGVGTGGLRWRHMSVVVLASLAASPVAREIAPGSSLRARHGWAALAACGHVVRGRFELPVCGGWFAGAVRAEATGLSASRVLRLPWTGGYLGVGVRYMLHALVGVTLDAHALIPVVRPSFVVEGLGVVHRAAYVAAGGQLGLEIRFP